MGGGEGGLGKKEEGDGVFFGGDGGGWELIP